MAFTYHDGPHRRRGKGLFRPLDPDATFNTQILQDDRFVWAEIKYVALVLAARDDLGVGS